MTSRHAVAACMAAGLLAASGCTTREPAADSSHDSATATQSPSSSASPSSQTTAPTASDAHVGAFDAMVAFGHCSGSIIRLPGQKDSDQALLLTNGHCTRLPLPPGVFKKDLPVTAKAEVFKGKTPKVAGVVGIDRLVYATMTGTDIGIFRLSTTFKELRDKGHIRAREISPTPAKPGMTVTVASGYWKKSWTCKVGKVVPIVQEGQWRFGDVASYERGACEMKGGTSGAPVIDDATGQVVAINNSGNTQGKRCTKDNPCEIYPPHKIVAIKGAGYATQTALLTSCFKDGVLALDAPDCRLPGGSAYAPVPSTPKP